MSGADSESQSEHQNEQAVNAGRAWDDSPLFRCLQLSRGSHRETMGYRSGQQPERQSQSAIYWSQERPHRELLSSQFTSYSMGQRFDAIPMLRCRESTTQSVEH